MDSHARKPDKVADAAVMDRRQFLKWMGLFGVAAVVGAGIRGMSSVLDAAAAAQETNAATVAVEVAETSSTAATAEVEVAQASAAAESSTSSTCTVRCRNGCSYPGACKRYVDGNGNGRCDYGECM